MLMLRVGYELYRPLVLHIDQQTFQYLQAAQDLQQSLLEQKEEHISQLQRQLHILQVMCTGNNGRLVTH